MAKPITKQVFLEDAQGRTFADVLEDPDQPFDAVLAFFRDESRVVRMEESELHHDRPPLAGVVRELEALPSVDDFLSRFHTQKSNRFRQAIGALVRMLMESRGWRKTGRKGSLGVRASGHPREAKHNSGGLAFWFIRAERYQPNEGMPFRSVKERASEYGEKLSRGDKRSSSDSSGNSSKTTSKAKAKDGSKPALKPGLKSAVKPTSKRGSEPRRKPTRLQ